MGDFPRPSFATGVSQRDSEADVQALRKEIEDLRNENKRLKTANQKSSGKGKSKDQGRNRRRHDARPRIPAALQCKVTRINNHSLCLRSPLVGVLAGRAGLRMLQRFASLC